MYAIVRHIRLIALQDLQLYFAPFVGAVKAVRIELSRPKSSGIENIAMDDVKLFFSPLIGAIEEIKKELNHKG